ncbi:TK/FAK protein kinase [Aphelenchoides besseyi]|nr:TK/FAK protein kinase [Aphelenchoides besseyi]
MSTQIIQIYLADGTAKNVRVDSFTTVQVSLKRKELDVQFRNLSEFSTLFLRVLASIVFRSATLLFDFVRSEVVVREAPKKTAIGYITHFENLKSVGKVLERLMTFLSDRHYIQPQANGQQLRFELRLRFLPRGLHEMMQTQLVAYLRQLKLLRYLFLWDQLLNDYVRRIAWRVDNEKAIAMAAIAIRKRFPTITSQNVEKRLDFTVIDAEGGLLRYLPESLVVASKKKQLQKQLIAAVRKIAHLSELECVSHFMKQLRSITRFDTEVFRVSIGNSWHKPVELFIGPHFGIAYKNENTKEPVTLCDLRSVIDLSLRRLDSQTEHCALRVKISGCATPMIITIPTISMAESLAHLLDGYQMLLSQQASVWCWTGSHDYLRIPTNNLEVPRKKSETLSPVARRRIVVQPDPPPRVDIESTTLAETLHLDPTSVHLEELLGSGQYGNVYRGLYSRNGKRKHVAVKVGKTDVAGEEAIVADRLLLEEANTMSRFDHENIIRLIGVVCRKAVWVVLELAELGELRQYLKRERETLELFTLLLFSRQIASAVEYLHSHLYVHRDLAARNVLVVSPKTVKLSDFGMSRFLEATNTKLPLKWLPVESLNERKFTTRSDVYQLGVCFWEILSLGEKPWQGVRNHEIVTKLENGNVLSQPERCPNAVYDLLFANVEVESGKKDRKSSTSEKHFNPDKLTLLSEETPKISATPFKVDIAQLEAVVLRRTLAEQRAQGNADDQWLREQELELEKERSVGDLPHASIRIHDEFPFRSNDPIHKSATELLQATGELSHSFEKPREELTNSVEKVLVILEQLVTVSGPHRELLDQSHKNRVKAIESLLIADGRRLTSTLSRAIDSNWGKQEEADYCREAFRICCVLGANTRRYLETFDDARLSSGVPLVNVNHNL